MTLYTSRPAHLCRTPDVNYVEGDLWQCDECGKWWKLCWMPGWAWVTKWRAPSKRRLAKMRKLE